MPRALIKARQAVSRRIGVGIVILTMVSVTLLALTIWLFMGLEERTEAVASSVREDAVWAAFQADREASRLVEAIFVFQSNPTLANAADLRLRFDLLYSRMDLFGSGTYAVSFGAGSTVGANAERLSGYARNLALEVDRLGSEPGAVFPAIRQLLADAQTIRQTTGALIVAANAAVNTLRVESRSSALATYWRIGAAVSALTLMLVLIVVLLGLQLRHIARSGREIELLNQKYIRSAEEARAASEAKSTFLATMSHEIRTPLNGIIGMADLMSDSQLNAEQYQQLEVIRQSGDILLDVITDILDYSKLEAGAMSIEPLAMSLPAMVESVRAIMAPRVRQGLTLSVTAAQVQITADQSRLRQILINLVGNAVKFTSSGSIEVNAEIDAKDLFVRVTDTGPGIAADQIGKLFREFSQLDGSSTRLHGGTGLGLAICKRLVEAMSGTLGVQSDVGHGSTFWFRVPVSPVELLARAATPAVPIETQATKFMGSVLVVDDNGINREVAAGLLGRLGYSVDCAENGAEALRAMSAKHYELVLMDMQMPILDGPTATQLARAQGYDMPILGLTANAYQSDRDICLAAGMSGHLAKPLTRGKLLAALGELSLPLFEGQTAEVPAIDTDYQALLVEEFGLDRFGDLATQFSIEKRLLVHAARAALARQDGQAYDAALHTLKGSALTLGFTAIAEAASSLRHSSSAEEGRLAWLEACSVYRAA